MNTLIVFATKYGSAEKCAHILKEKLDGDVEVVNIKTDHIPDISNFENIVIGGSIYVGKIQQEIRNFCKQHLEALLTKKIGLFICGGEKPEITYEELKNAFPGNLYEHAVAKETFGDELHFEKLSLIEKLVLRMKGVKTSYSNLSYDNIEKLANTINASF